MGDWLTVDGVVLAYISYGMAWQGMLHSTKKKKAA
jgi:hypothetical protein